MADNKSTDTLNPLNGKLVTSVDPAQAAVGDFQNLTNLRYNDNGVEGVKGQTKINTSVVNATNLKIRNAHHAFKTMPETESEVLVQAFNAAETASAVYKLIYNSGTDAPSQKAFEATALFTESANSGTGHFAETNEGVIVYTNGVDKPQIYAGTKARPISVLQFQEDNKEFKDLTDQVTNLSESTEFVATLTRDTHGQGSVLYHFDDNLTDSADAARNTTWTGGGSPAYAAMKFGNGIDLSGATKTLDISVGLADFEWTVDFKRSFWLKIPALSGTHTVEYRYQAAAPNDYYSIHVTSAGAVVFEYSRNGSVVTTTTEDGVIVAGTLYNVVVLGDKVKNNAYAVNILIGTGGILKAYATSFSSAVWPTGFLGTDHVWIGSNSTPANYLIGYLDEYYVSTTDTSAAPYLNSGSKDVAYRTTGVDSYTLYIGSTRPKLNAINITMGSTVNAQASTLSAKYWSASGWTELSPVSDGTASGGASFAQTGSITFTAPTDAALRFINGEYFYWYKLLINGTSTLTNSIKIKAITVSEPMQDLVDVWDGEHQDISRFYVNKDGVTYDYSQNVVSEDYDNNIESTFADIGSLDSDDYMYVGFTDRMSAIKFKMRGGHANGVSGTRIKVYYWNGKAFVEVTNLEDGTLSAGKAFASTGYVTWTPPAYESEYPKDMLHFKKRRPRHKKFKMNKWAKPISAGTTGSPAQIHSKKIIEDDDGKLVSRRNFPGSLYVYKVMVTQILTSGTSVVHVSGIPAPNPIKPFESAFTFDERVCLVGEKYGQANSVLMTSQFTADVLNGDDSVRLFFGDAKPCRAGAQFFMSYGSNMSQASIVCKDHETWLIYGEDVTQWSLSRISDSVGCVAPLTMKSVLLGYDTGGGFYGREGVIWQGDDGIYMFNGKSPVLISGDIQDIFTDGTISQAFKTRSSAFVDNILGEYHWQWSSNGTSLNKESVYDYRRNKWFTFDRTANMTLNCGLAVQSTTGLQYMYGCGNTGYMWRLENGATFDGQDVAHTLWTTDYPLAGGGAVYETKVRNLKLVSKAKTETDTVTVTHYKDGKADTPTASISQNKTGYRITNDTKSSSINWGDAVFHSFKFQVSTGTDTIGFEPLMLHVQATPTRRDVGTGG